uniref:C-type lectin domain-containing protein n=1 Tax=Acrobeloides nanus TaxID=290746 RepID=A0A914D5W6_9BILA
MSLFDYFFVFLTLLLGCLADCPAGSLRGSTSTNCYKVVGSPTSFLEAQSICLSHNGNLTSINSAYENLFLASNLAELFPTSPNIWTGGNRIIVPGNWTWMDNRPFSYTNWNKGQPSSVSGNDCLTLNLPAGTWSAQSCSLTLPFICEVPSTSDQALTSAPCTAPTVPPHPTYSCESGWHYFEYTNQCYNISNAGNWQTARLYCMQVGGQLASIHNAAENGFIIDIIPNLDGDTWIGLNKLEGSWEWIDNTPVGYTDWAYKEPSGDGSCALINNVNGYDRLHWNDYDCNGIRNFVCKKSAMVSYGK